MRHNDVETNGALEVFTQNNHFDISWAGDDNFHLLRQRRAGEIISRNWTDGTSQASCNAASLNLNYFQFTLETASIRREDKSWT